MELRVIRLMIISKIEKLSSLMVLTSGWQRLMVAFLVGALSSFSMPPFYLFPILFVTFPIFIWLVDAAYSDARQNLIKTAFSSFLLGWWFGFGYFVAGLWWIGNALLVEADAFAWALPLAIVILPAMLAIFWGFATVLARILWRENWTRVLTLALSFGLFEYLRGFLFTGFPWNSLGYAAMPLPFTMQSASVIGIYGVTTLCIIIFASPFVAAIENSGKKILWMISVGLLFLHLGYGFVRISNNPTQFVENVSLRLVQPNIPQIDKLKREAGDKTVQTYLDLSKKKGLEKTTHIFWPESAFPFLLTERSDVLAKIAELVPENVQLYTGAARAEPGSGGNPYGRVYNSIYSINFNGEIVEAADKVHLVPFGEYLPFQRLLETFGFEQLTRLRGGFEAGSSRQLLDAGIAGSILPLICYEIIFSGEMLDRTTRNSDWILNVTNDAWYGRTPGPYQHHHQSIVRAVELGLPLIRVANSGISAVVDPYGRTIGKLGLYEKSILDSKLPKKAASTYFRGYADKLLWTILLVLALMVIGRNYLLGKN